MFRIFKNLVIKTNYQITYYVHKPISKPKLSLAGRLQHWCLQSINQWHTKIKSQSGQYLKGKSHPNQKLEQFPETLLGEKEIFFSE